jgi:L-galactose dehydrogenase
MPTVLRSSSVAAMPATPGRARLGRTNLDVSVASLGTGGYSRLGQEYGVSVEDSAGLVRTALDEGVDFIDTAPSYGTEQIVGRAVAGRRDSVVISTKAQIFQNHSDPQGHDLLSAAELRDGLHGSLGRLGTDYVDVFHLHGVTPSQYAYCVQEYGPELARLKEQGTIRFAGISERFRTDPGHQMLQLALADEADLFDVVMAGLNFVNQTALTRVLPGTQARDIGTQLTHAVRGRLATAAGAAGLVAEAIAVGEVDPADLDPGEPLDFLRRDPSVSSLVDACYRFNRHAPGADVILTSTGRLGHLRENIASINSGPLPAAVLDRLAAIFGRVESLTGD